MLTIAERVGDAIVTKFYEDMQDPRYRGSKFNPYTFDIEGWIDVHLYLYYRRKSYPKPQVRARALSKARELWNKHFKINDSDTDKTHETLTQQNR